jgi:hypothetical protein
MRVVNIRCDLALSQKDKPLLGFKRSLPPQVNLVAEN